MHVENAMGLERMEIHYAERCIRVRNAAVKARLNCLQSKGFIEWRNESVEYDELF